MSDLRAFSSEVDTGSREENASKQKALSSTTAAARRRALFRPATTAGFIGFALDPDDRKNQDGAHAKFSLVAAPT
jgi:hypothetical protein